MLNIKDLEQRHMKYKIKSYIPYFIIIFILGTLSIIAFNIFTTKVKIQKQPIIQKEIIKIKKVAIDTNITKKEPRKIQKKQEKQKVIIKKIILKPSLDFMRRVNTPVDAYSNEKKINKKKMREKEIIQEVIVEPVIPKKEKYIEETQEIKSIKIKRNKNKEDISEVIKRFKKNDNPALSLFIAKKYYQAGNYHKSYNYALITNQINRNIESSWIIFAKSLMKLNKKKMAIDTLKKYINDSNSNRAKILLDEIQSGKFK